MKVSEVAVPLSIGGVALALALVLPASAVGDRDSDKVSAPHTQQASPHEAATTMKIRLTINGRTVIARLHDNATARDFLALLPLTLTLDDYAATEKIAYLPRKLTTFGAPAGFTPSTGDIAYYAPWGNLAIFLKGFRYSEGLISLGWVDAGAEALKAGGPLTAVVERSGE